MNVLEALSMLLFEGSLQAGLAGLLIALLASLVRGRDARIAHGLLAIALLKFAVPPVLPFPTGLFTGIPIRVHVESPTGETSTLLQLLLVAYFAGFAIVGARRLLEILELRRIVRLSSRPSEASRSALASVSGIIPLRTAPVLRVSPEIPVPCTFGLLRPVIIIPQLIEERLTDEQMRAVLLHELSHLRRHDTVWNVASTLLGVVWWFHPVFHLVDRIARQVREDRCDEMVVRHAGIHPRVYARTIVNVAACQAVDSPAFAPAAASTTHPLGGRIKNIARLVDREKPLPRTLGAAALLAAAVVLLPGIDVTGSPEPDRVFFVHGSNSHHDRTHRH